MTTITEITDRKPWDTITHTSEHFKVEVRRRGQIITAALHDGREERKFDTLAEALAFVELAENEGYPALWAANRARREAEAAAKATATPARPAAQVSRSRDCHYCGLPLRRGVCVECGTEI